MVDIKKGQTYRVNNEGIAGVEKLTRGHTCVVVTEPNDTGVFEVKMTSGEDEGITFLAEAYELEALA